MFLLKVFEIAPGPESDHYMKHRSEKVERQYYVRDDSRIFNRFVITLAVASPGQREVVDQELHEGERDEGQEECRQPRYVDSVEDLDLLGISLLVSVGHHYVSDHY